MAQILRHTISVNSVSDWNGVAGCANLPPPVEPMFGFTLI